jgi:2-methylcitrate dehydratase PrpD
MLAEISERARAASAGASSEVLAAAAQHTLDTVACISSGATHPLARDWLPLLPAFGCGEAALGAPGLWCLETAVEIDATLAHLDEFDALHSRAGVAPGAVVVPAALLLGATRPANGEAVARAIIAGYEAIVEVALRFGGATLYEAGWWPTALFGAIGSAAAAADLLGLAEAERVTALALAVAPLGGLLSSDELGAGHYLLCGSAAARGVWAANAAAAGLTASPSLLDRPAAAALGRSGLPASPAGCHLLEAAIKHWPCARPLHTALAALDELAAEDIAPAEGDSVCVALPTPLLRFVTAARLPAGPTEAAASAAVAVGGAVIGRARDPIWYRDVAAGRAALPDVAVELRSLPSLDAEFPARWGAQVTVRSRSGSVTRRSLSAPGDRDRPLSVGALRSKAGELMRMPADDPVLERLLRLAEEPDVAVLCSDLISDLSVARRCAITDTSKSLRW